jgi:magnesium chelatase family protein
VIHISRAARQATFPAEFQLVAAMNPCPCGWLGHVSGRCHCTPEQVARYRGRVSGPLIDRIDLGIEVPPLDPRALAVSATSGETGAGIAVHSDTVRGQVCTARSRQLARQGKPNARLTSREIDTHCIPDAEGAEMLAKAMAQLAFSARAYHRILKVSRTIADLAGEATITAPDVAEAIGYRRFERG